MACADLCHEREDILADQHLIELRQVLLHQRVVLRLGGTQLPVEQLQDLRRRIRRRIARIAVHITAAGAEPPFNQIR